MALGYPDISQPFATSGAGTALIGTYWVPALEASLQTPMNFMRFAEPGIMGTPLLMAGQGQQVNFNYADPITVDGSALTEGTRTPYGTQGLIPRTATVGEYGKGMPLSGLQAWLTNPNVRPDMSSPAYYQAMEAIQALTTWSLATADYKIGEAIVASQTTNFININGSSTVTFGATGAGTYDFTASNVMEMQAGLLSRGIAGRPELGGRWAVIGGAGAFNKIKQIDGIQRDAAALGIDALFSQGFQFAWQNFVFFDLFGVEANTLIARPGANTVGLSYVIGGGALVHENTIGGPFSVNAPSWMVYYPDYGQDNGRVQLVQANFKAITAVTVNTAAKHRIWQIRSYQNA